MAGSAEMKLVFRLAGLGFSLPVNQLVEIVDLEKKPTVSRKKDAPPLPQADFRGDKISVVNVAEQLGLKASPAKGSLTMLVLHGELGSWGALVDSIEGIRPDGEFQELTLSPFFSLGGAQLYDKIDVWRDEPLIRWEPDRFAPKGESA
jgi:purine-binding chemotaxis protein CheW